MYQKTTYFGVTYTPDDNETYQVLSIDKGQAALEQAMRACWAVEDPERRQYMLDHLRVIPLYSIQFNHIPIKL